MTFESERTAAAREERKRQEDAERQEQEQKNYELAMRRAQRLAMKQVAEEVQKAKTESAAELAAQREEEAADPAPKAKIAGMNMDILGFGRHSRLEAPEGRDEGGRATFTAPEFPNLFFHQKCW